MKTPLRLHIAGQSGSGMPTVEFIVVSALRRLGWEVFSDREFASLIHGGHSVAVINVSPEPIRSSSRKADVMVSIDKPSLKAYFDRIEEGGIWVHGYERLSGVKSFIEKAQDRNIGIQHLCARKTAHQAGGNDLMQNVVLIGMLWKTLGLPFEVIEAEVEAKLGKKKVLWPANLACLKAGYDGVKVLREDIKYKKEGADKMVISGNHALALGAVHGGVRVYYAYPMSPSSSILTHMADIAKEVGLIVKQGEDEITVANLNMGSWYSGTRSLCATSGGGYDLMTETVSLAGIIETPWVGIIVQRPGPATGLPTWTAQGDLNLAIYASHGEFARCVIAVSDPEDCFTLIQQALNLAEKFQIPVIVLSEKIIGESMFTCAPFAQNTIPIERHLVTGKDLENIESTDRYKITEDGISKRWIPCSHGDKYYFANGDEHDEMGRLDEDESVGEMYAKRVRKLEALKADLPEAEVYGFDSNQQLVVSSQPLGGAGFESGADISFVGWGSSKNVMKDVIQQLAVSNQQLGKVNYLHFSYVYPLRTEVLERFFADNPNVHLIEGNHTGQLGQLIEQHTDLKFAGKLLKWDGRPFYREDVEEYIADQLAASS